jgi:hypothetical protein
MAVISAGPQSASILSRKRGAIGRLLEDEWRLAFLLLLPTLVLLGLFIALRDPVDNGHKRYFKPRLARQWLIVERFSGLLAQFEPDRMSGFRSGGPWRDRGSCHAWAGSKTK